MTKTKSYWEKRQEQWIKNQDKSDAVISNRLKKDYRRTSRELEKEISRYFQKYGKDDVLEYRQMMKDLSDDDKRTLYEDMNAFAEKFPEYEHLMPVRESIYRLNRLEGLHYSTQLRLLELGAIEQEVFEKHLLDTYGKNYELLLSELNIGHSFLSVNDELAYRTIYTKWVDGKNFSDRIWDNKEKLMNYMRNDFRDSLIRGDSYAKMTKKLTDRMNVGSNDAKRLVWTESSFVLNQAHTHPYIDLGIEEYALNAIIDGRTSDICKELDKRAKEGETFRFDEIVVGINFPPFHAYCRTTFIGVGLDEFLN